MERVNGSLVVASQWTATFHAIQRYQERVGPHPPRFAQVLPLPVCAAELLWAVRAPLFTLPLRDGGALLGCLNASGILFVAKVYPDARRIHSCGPPWFWHETRSHWKRIGVNPRRINEVQRLIALARQQTTAPSQAPSSEWAAQQRERAHT